MCPPKQCCCCGLVLGLTINCCVIAFFLFLILPYNVYNLSELAFWCDPTTTDAHIAAYDAGELDKDCGDKCNVQEHGMWHDIENDPGDPVDWYGEDAEGISLVPVCETESVPPGSGANTYNRLAAGKGPLNGGRWSWSAARKGCSSLGNNTHLVSIGSKEENTMVRRACGEYMCWIGYEKVGGVWRWSDGSNPTPKYENWFPNEPTQWTAKETKTHMNGIGMEMVEMCSNLRTLVYVRVFYALVLLVVSGVGFVGIRTFNSMLLDVHWIGHAVGLAFDFFFSIYEIEAGVDSRPDFWKLRTIFHAVSLVVTLTWGGLVGWYIVGVRSMSTQVKAGTISKENPGGAPRAQDPYQAPYIGNEKSTNPVATVDTADV